VSMCLRSEVSSTPSTTMRPCWCSSRRLMQRIVVDLPEPEGPHSTMRSPWRTERLMSLRTWNSPYHLFTSCISIMMVSPRARLFELSVIAAAFLSFVSGVQAAFEAHRVARHAEAEDPVHRCGKYVA